MSPQPFGVFSVRARPPEYQQWDLFEPGERVELWSMDTFLFTAFVDDRTEDGKVLWVIEERTGARRLFLHSDQVRLRPA